MFLYKCNFLFLDECCAIWELKAMTVLNMRDLLLTVTLKSRLLRLQLGCAKAKGGIRITPVNLPVRCYPLFYEKMHKAI